LSASKDRKLLTMLLNNEE